MAKLSFTKLSLKNNLEIKTIEINGQKVEIKQYLPIEEKLELIETVINNAADDKNYSNTVKEDIYFSLELIKKYTNITFTEKQEEDPCKLYDLLKSNGVFNEIMQNIPEEEIMELQSHCRGMIQSIYRYRNSAMGILDIIAQDYSDTNVNLENIQKAFAENHDNIAFLKDVVTKLG